MKIRKRIPLYVRPFLWSYDIKKMDMQKDARIIIHQVLSYGTLNDIRKLIKYYGKNKVKREFLKPMLGLYPANILDFLKLLLGIKRLNKKKYIKNILYENSYRFTR